MSPVRTPFAPGDRHEDALVHGWRFIREIVVGLEQGCGCSSRSAPHPWWRGAAVSAMGHDVGCGTDEHSEVAVKGRTLPMESGRS